MVQRIRDFAEGQRRRLGIVVRCDGCGKRATYRCQDFDGYIAPNAEIEDLIWRCSWCRSVSTWMRYTLIDDMQRQDLAQWMPPPGRKRRW